MKKIWKRHEDCGNSNFLSYIKYKESSQHISTSTLRVVKNVKKARRVRCKKGQEGRLPDQMESKKEKIWKQMWRDEQKFDIFKEIGQN